MLTSIIIPAYNRERLIGVTLDSVLAQTYPYWEALVIDDGSTDNTCKAVSAYSAKDARVKLIQRSRESKGGSVCRNIGIENAQGEYLIFLDSDDLLEPFCLQQRIEYIRSHPELDFAVFQMGVFNEQGITKEFKIAKTFDNYLYAFLRHDLPWAITCPLWKASFVRNNLNGYNETYPRLQDPEFNTRALMADNVRFDVLAHLQPDCLYRSHTDKLFNVTILLSGFYLYIKEFAEWIKSRQDSDVCRRQLKYCYIEAVKGFYSYYSRKFHSESIQQITTICTLAYKKEIIAAHTVCLSRMLFLLYRIQLSKLPGGRYFLRIIMKLIKIF